jgi:ABC-type polysaccharide/polyol phosphate export permease
MTGLIESFRDVLIEGRLPELNMLLPSVIGAVVVLAIGTSYFAATEKRFADVI